ncbi:MAG TPA: hypothetical protein PLU93_00835, partial [Treponemataceae bacterium]|nr:hypothetical protein [Treponemataceae bacterium]
MVARFAGVVLISSAVELRVAPCAAPRAALCAAPCAALCAAPISRAKNAGSGSSKRSASPVNGCTKA